MCCRLRVKRGKKFVATRTKMNDDFKIRDSNLLLIILNHLAKFLEQHNAHWFDNFSCHYNLTICKKNSKKDLQTSFEQIDQFKDSNLCFNNLNFSNNIFLFLI